MLAEQRARRGPSVPHASLHTLPSLLSGPGPQEAQRAAPQTQDAGTGLQSQLTSSFRRAASKPGERKEALITILIIIIVEQYSNY